MRSRFFLTAGIIAVLVAMLFLTYNGALADFSPQHWRYAKPILLPLDLQNEGLVELDPDEEVFGGATPGLVDVRIIDSDGMEIPYKLEVRRGERRESFVTSAVRDRGLVPGQYSTFVVDTGPQRTLHNAMRLDFSYGGSFLRTATVDTSDDGSQWLRVAEQPIVSVSIPGRGLVARDTLIRYPESSSRLLRVQVDTKGEEPLQVSSAVVLLIGETTTRESQRESTVLGITRDQGRRNTLVDIDLGGPGIPIHRLVLSVSDANFYREVTLQTSPDRKEWSNISSGGAVTGTIYSYNTPRLTSKNLSISYPEVFTRYLRLVIHDEDSPPLDLLGIEVWGIQRRLVFTASPVRSYQLFYGNPDAPRPTYDIERLFPFLATGGLLNASLGQQLVNDQFVEKKPPVSERFPWLLPLVYFVAAILVAAALLSVVLKARKLLPPPS